ncbi:MAG: hypothetical protein ETSY1_33050 [Candidatus Entotheonella factor]|uniref:Uncharacterized protein n=1 Tax=Entotheonella factor TaxID=1429438 RepID=W4LAY5_ENTF1|nr:MAG: hypothetical protein ETSY1_33050 [Candidatus Entotheonella factor]
MIKVWKGSYTRGRGPCDMVYRDGAFNWQGDGAAWKGSYIEGNGPADVMYKAEGYN